MQDVGLEVNAKKSRDWIVYHQQDTVQNQNNHTNKAIENLATMLMNQNCMHEEIKTGNACYCIVQNVLSSCMASNFPFY